MAAIKWASGVSGNWTTKADWTGGVVPGSGDDVTIDAAGKFAVTISSGDAAHSLTLNNATATIVDTGALTIGTTLALTAGTFDLNSGGTISGGTLSATGGKFQFAGGELDGVTYDGPLNLATASSRVAISSNGIVLKGAGGTGSGTVNLSGASASLYFQGSQTLDNATVNLSGASDYLEQYFGGPAPSPWAPI